MPEYRRDPVSVVLDQAARRLLERAYAAPGTWKSTRLADPPPSHVAHFAAQGIDLAGPDNAPAEGGTELNAYTRWARGYVRAIYYQHLWFSPNSSKSSWRATRRQEKRSAGALEVHVGRRVRATGVIPAGRMISVILHPGGKPARQAASLITAGRSDPAGRDWQ